LGPQLSIAWVPVQASKAPALERYSCAAVPAPLAARRIRDASCLDCSATLKRTRCIASAPVPAMKDWALHSDGLPAVSPFSEAPGNCVVASNRNFAAWHATGLAPSVSGWAQAGRSAAAPVLLAR